MTVSARILFILFYFAASGAVAKDRSVHAAGRLKTSPTVASAIKSPYRQIQGLPFFSHAKKPRPYVVAVLAQAILVIKSAFSDRLDEPGFESAPAFHNETRSSRSPPMLC